MTNASETTILVLQGGGALGAYQAGAFEGLAQADIDVNWVAGISIGAINAALICGNEPENRLQALKGFWDQITSQLTANPWMSGDAVRQMHAAAASASVMMNGVPGFFKPRNPFEMMSFGGDPALSVYDTEPLRETLNTFVDFDYLNNAGPRLSVGAVDIETANFTYFDSANMRIGPEHIMASGALPPGFPPVEIDGRLYWDGGLVSNTPLQFVMQNLGHGAALIFQIDVFKARGARPKTMDEASQRAKDIQYSSRTRLTTDRYKQLQDVRLAAKRLAEKLPKDLQDDPDLMALQTFGPSCPITLMHLIHDQQAFENSSKDYEFSRITMTDHWTEGRDDMVHSLSHPDWIAREIGAEGLHVYDFTNDVPVPKNSATMDQ